MPDDIVKTILKRIPYGFYAVTSRSGDDKNIMVANWVVQSSFTPRYLTLALQKGSYTQGLVESGRVFALNLFLQSDGDAVRPFTKGRAKNPDKLAGAEFKPAARTGCPVMAQAAAYLECEVVAIHDDGGDHVLVVGQVVGGEEMKAGEVGDTLNLPEFGWSYAG